LETQELPVNSRRARAQSLSSNEYPESLSVVYVQFKNSYDVEYKLALLLSTGYTRVKVGM